MAAKHYSVSSSRRARRSVIIITLGVVAIAGLAAPPSPKPGTLVWNYTPSVPIGLYRIDDRPWRKGDRVAVAPSGEASIILSNAKVLEPGRLLLKRVAASVGDVVCRNGAEVTINGRSAVVARLNDGHGKSLPVWDGCLNLSANDVFLLGETPASFDGRYFGVSAAADIVGRLTPLLISDN